MSDTVLAQVAALKAKSLPELRALWKELFDRDPPPLGRRYLEHRLSYRIQELRCQGLSERARRRLDVLADQLAPKAARRCNRGRPIAGVAMATDLTDPIFTDEDAARAHFEKIRWPNGPICPHCGLIDNATELKGKSTRPGVYK